MTPIARPASILALAAAVHACSSPQPPAAGAASSSKAAATVGLADVRAIGRSRC